MCKGSELFKGGLATIRMLCVEGWATNIKHSLSNVTLPPGSWCAYTCPACAGCNATASWTQFLPKGATNNGGGDTSLYWLNGVSYCNEPRCNDLAGVVSFCVNDPPPTENWGPIFGLILVFYAIVYVAAFTLPIVLIIFVIRWFNRQKPQPVSPVYSPTTQLVI